MKIKDKALLVAEKVHMGQTYDIFPYIYHIKEVVRIAEELGYDESIIVSCYLHDSMEDGNLSYNDILQSFGVEVAEIVFAVTDELGRNRLERKTKTYPKIRANWKATVVKICDRIANISHSKEFTPKLFKMYENEHEGFCRDLMNPDHPHIETNRAWFRLKETLN